jgi:hypothetical protein
LPLAVFVPAALNDLSVDVSVGSPAQGAIFYRGATVWNALAAGTNGQVLTSGGAAANPSWTTLPADTDTLATLTDVTLSGTAQGDLLYRGASAWNNLAHGTAGQLLQSGGAAANPSWVTPAVDTDTFAALTDVTLTTPAQGDVYYRNAAGNVVNLAPGTSGQFLKTQGAAANPLWASLPADTDTFAALTDVSLTTPAQGDVYYRNAAGNVVNLAPGTSGQVLQTGGAAANPSWLTLPVDTDTLATLTDVSLTAVAQGDVLYRGAATWNNLAHGVTGQVLSTNGAGANPSWINAPNPAPDLILTRAGAANPADPKYFTITAGADTALAAGVEANDILWSLARTQQFATGALATQRAFVITAPTYAFVGASTITNAATVHVVGAPVAGTNATITNGAALWVQGQVCFGSLITGTSLASLTLAPGQSNTTPTCLLVQPGAGTALTASVEAIDVQLAFARTVQWATGALTTQRAFWVRQPTYAFVGASTLTNAATVAIEGAPVAGTNATLTNSYALWIQTGAVQIGSQAVNAVMAVGKAVDNAITPAPLLAVKTAADTAITAGTEASGIVFDLSASRQWATGALALQRELRIQPPTYAFVGASTITNAVTVAIEGAPVAGTNATITNPTALRVLTGSDAGIGLLIQANSGTQSGDLVRVMSSAGGSLFRVNAIGETGIGAAPVGTWRLRISQAASAPASFGLRSDITTSDPANNNCASLFFGHNINHPTGTITNAYGAWGYCTNNSASVSNPVTYELQAFYGLARQSASGIVDTATCFGGYMTHDPSTGTVNNWQGFYSSGAIGANNTVGALAHFQAHGMTPGAGTVITTQYAFYVDNALTGATTNYGLYTTGATPSYIGGNLGIGQTTATARLHLPAGSAAASTAPLKLATGPLLTTTEAGTFEFLTPTFACTPVATRRALCLSSDSITANTTVANTVTETTLFTGTVAANEMAAGKRFRATLAGRYSGLGTDNWTMRFKMGGTTFLTLTSTAAVVTNGLFSAEFTVTCRTTGAAGTVIGNAWAIANNGLLSSADTGTHTVDTTAAENLTVTLQWSAASASDTLTLTEATLELLD